MGNFINVMFNVFGGVVFNGIYCVSVSDEYGCEIDQFDVIVMGIFFIVVDFVFVLDVFGSMGGDVCNSCDNFKL